MKTPSAADPAINTNESHRQAGAALTEDRGAQKALCDLQPLLLGHSREAEETLYKSPVSTKILLHCIANHKNILR